MRNVLILTFHFPPSAASGSFRLLGFARHLPRFGWRPLVVAPPSVPWEPIDEALTGRIPPEALVRYVPYPSSWLTLPLRLYAPYVSWFAAAWWTIGRLVQRFQPEAILTSGPPHQIHVLGLCVKRRHRLPWIADFRDPWIAGHWLDGAGAVGRGAGAGAGANAKAKRETWRRRRERREERMVMEEADLIVANAPAATSRMRECFPTARHKTVTITNGYDPEAFDGLADARATPGDVLRIVHPGQLYVGRDPRGLLDAIREIRAERLLGARSIRFDLIGHLDADCRAFDLGTEIRARGLEEVVHLGGQVPYARSLEEMVRSDILLLLDSPGRKSGVPAKVYEYLGAGRPILALGESDGDLAWVLKESGVPHRIAPPGDPGGIKRALLELAAIPAGPRPRCPKFTREALTGELARHLDRCAGRRPAAITTATATAAAAAQRHDDGPDDDSRVPVPALGGTSTEYVHE